MIEGASETEEVLSDLAPETIPIATTDSSKNICLRWWTDSDRSSVIHAYGRVWENIYKKLDGAGIDMPYPTQAVLLHDQIEEHDGDRSKQRGGWPANPDVDNPQTSASRNHGARGLPPRAGC
jgi:small-conductance mechanosensitive channel